MSNRNEDRTLSGSTEMYVDILDLPQTINAIRVKNVFGSAGQVLAKNPTTNKLEWAVVPIADDTITTNMIQDLAITDAKIANNTITGGKLSSSINIDTTGTLTIGGVATFKGVIIFNNGETAIGTFAPTTGTLTLPAGTFTQGLTVGSGNWLVVGETLSTFNTDILVSGDIELASGGTRVFNMNSHNLTNGGDATFNNLTLNTALNMSNINLDLGTGNLTCADITADGNVVVKDGATTKITLHNSNGRISCIGLESGGSPIDSEGAEIRSGGGIINTENGNLNYGSGTLSGTGAVNCGAITATGNIDAGSNNINGTVGNFTAVDTSGISGPTTMSGVFTYTGSMNVGYLEIDSAGSGHIRGPSGTSNLDINAYSGFIQCDGLSTNNSNLLLGTGQISNISSIFGTGLFRANELQLNSTGLGINTTNVVYPNTADIRGYNIYNSTNDIPRILACKSFTADHSYSRTINTSYKNIDKDTTTLNVSFAVPISCKIIVEVGFYVGSTLNNERLMLKLVDNTGAEFYGKFINDSNHGFSTENMECQFAGSGNLRGQTVITKFFLSFPTSKRNNTVNLQPQAATNTGSCSITAGGSSSGQTPPMYVKVESLGSTSAYNWHMETSSGGDDY